MDFSPDAKYYLEYVEGEFHLYDSRTDREVSLPTAAIPDRWVPTGGSRLLLRKRIPRPPGLPPYVTPNRAQGPVDVDYLVYDVESRQVVDSLRGRIPAWASPPGILPFVSGGRVNVISRP